MLKLDPKNTELLNQKQTVLNKSIETTQDKLKQLKEIKEKADQAMANGTQINEENYRNLQREIINTQNKLSDLKNETSNWTKAGDSLIKWGESFDKISAKIDNLGNKLTTRLTAPITAVAGLGIKYNADIEKYTTSFETFLGDAKEAEKAVNNIKKDASKTPFDVTSLVKANQMLVSTGENADDARKVINALGDAVIATGGGNDELTRMASNLQQIKNAGKATSMDIRQFAYAGIDVYGILANYLGKTTQEIKDMEISYDDLSEALKIASSQGGKYYGAMEKSSKTLTGQVNQLKAETMDMVGDLTKSLMPVAKKVVAKAKEVIKWFNNLSEAEKNNIVKIGLMVAAAGPLLKLLSSGISIIGGVSKGIGTFTKAIALAHNGIGTATGSAATLAKVFQGLTSPIGLAAMGIAAAVGIIVSAIANAEKETKEAFSNMGNSATDYIKGIDNAKSHLDDFNNELFVSSQEQKELEEQMDEVQKGITTICKTASDERRGYTQEEITQLDEYFQKLRELNQREIDIQNEISKAISQQAVKNAETFEGTLEEYKVQSQDWLKTAEDQKTKTLDLIDKQTIEEVALLNQRYSTEEQQQSEAYLNEYNKIMENKQLKIDAANDEVAKVSEAYANGYLERSKQSDSFYNTLKDYNGKVEEENEKHKNKLNDIDKNILLVNADKWLSIDKANRDHNDNLKKIYNDMYKTMSKEQEDELGIWLAQVAQTEMYGGQITDETKEIVDEILESYDKMPPETQETMKNAMEPMLKKMQEAEPSLFAKATGIADGILSRLKKSFDIHSPSKETRKIFENVMKGAELGLEDEEKRLNKQVDTIAQQMKDKFNLMMPNMGDIKQFIIDRTQTVFTTPQIVFNVQELDDAKLQQCFNYINKKFGSAY